MLSDDKIAVCDDNLNSLHKILTKLDLSCIRTDSDAISVTSAILSQGISAFAADARLMDSNMLLNVFRFLKSIDYVIPCFIIAPNELEFNQFDFVHTCARKWEFEELLRSFFGQSLCDDEKSECNGDAELERRVTEIIQRLGVPSNIKGYRYLRSAVMLATEDITMLDKVTKRLYPIIAEKNGTTVMCVERAIRHAIAAAWNKHIADAEFFEKNLHCRLDFDGKVPTNSELIALLSDMLRLALYR